MIPSKPNLSWSALTIDVAGVAYKERGQRPTVNMPGVGQITVLIAPRNNDHELNFNAQDWAVL